MSETWTHERMRQVFENVKNWGRWGDDDEMGALNLITPKKRREGAAAIVSGEAVSCALELAVLPSPENPSPALHMMLRAGDDSVTVPSGVWHGHVAERPTARWAPGGVARPRKDPRVAYAV